MKKHIKAVIFDMDGVLIDSETIAYDCFRQASLEVGAKWDEDFYLSTLGMNFAKTEESFIQFYGNKDTLDKVQEKCHKLLFDDAYPNGKVPLKKGCRQIIEHLKNKGIPCALATSSPMFMVELSFLNQGYDKIPFDYIMNGDQVTNSKPNPEIFLKAAKLLNTNPEDCLIVEDSKNGVKAARNANAVTVLVPDIIKPSEEMIANADYIKKDLFEVMDLIDELIVKD